VQERGGARVGKRKKGGKKGGSEGKEKEKGGEGNGEGKKGNEKGILAVPILVCFRRRCLSLCISDDFESLDAGSSFSHIRYISRKYMSSSCIKTSPPLVYTTNTTLGRPPAFSYAWPLPVT